MNEALLSVQAAREGAALEYSQYSNKPRARLSRRQRWTAIMLIFFVVILLAVRIYSLIAVNTKVALKVKSRADHELLDDTLIEFSFTSMVSNFWSAHAYIIAMLIVFGSAIVPITSSVFLIIYLLRKVLSAGSEEHSWAFEGAFVLLDSLSKFALVDVFFLSYVVIILGNQIVVFDLVYVHINANPVYALYTGATATLLLMLTFRLISCTFPGMQPQDAITLQQEQPRQSLVRRMASNGWQSQLFAWLGFMLVVVGLGLAFQRAIYDTLIMFKLEGLAGMALGEEGKKTFEVAKVGTRFVDNVDEAALGPVYLSTIYVVVAVVVPALLGLGWLLFWAVPLSEMERRRVGDACLALFQVMGMDVLVVATFAAYLEMYLIADWVFDDQFPTLCAEADKILKEPCVSLEHQLGPAFWSMILCVLAQAAAALLYGSYRSYESLE